MKKSPVGILTLGVVACTATIAYAAQMPRLDSSAAIFREVQADASPEKMRKATVAERTAAGKVIRAQLDAFARDDYKTAITYQSAALKKNFASTEAFRRMMRSTYPQFARYKTITFGRDQVNAAGTRLEILANVMGKDGVKVVCVYQMSLENKAWRVAGVAGGGQARTKPSVEV